jgi:exodeoxyribonuclease VIII
MPNIIKTRAEYDATIAINCSGMKHLLKSPSHYRANLTAEKTESKALRMGSLVHHIVLEATPATEKYAAIPEGIDRRTKEGKAAYSAFEAESVGKTILSNDEWEVCDYVAASMVRAKDAIGVTFTATELMFSVDYCGVTLKSAIDAVGDDGYLYDLKTAEDASPKGWLQAARNYRYALQSYFYRLAYEVAFGIRPKGFRFIVAEKEPPYEYAIYELGPEIMSYAVTDFEAGLKSYKSCMALDEWPGYGSDIKVIDIATKASTAEPIKFA